MVNAPRERWGWVVVVAVLPVVCCGIPLLVLSGVSLGFVLPQWPVLGVLLAVLGLVGFLWYLKRGCPTCPRNAGRQRLAQPPRDQA